MRIAMFTIGSTGDVLPYIALGRELQERGHHVTICAFPDFEKLVTEAGLSFFALCGNGKAFISEIINGSVGVGFLVQANKALKDLAQPLMDDIEQAARNADAIISNYVADIYQMVAEYLHIPYIQTQFFPMEETADFPITAAPFLHLGKLWNKTSYRLGYWLISAIEKHLLDPWRKKKGLPPIKRQCRRNYVINGHTLPVVYAIPEALLPRPKEWSPNVFMTGFWHDEQPYTPEEGLLRFLDDGPPPLYIGFGSMNGKKMERLMTQVMKALELSGLRAVVATGWSDASVQSNPNVYPVQYISHDWLFSRVCATVHHGGAGTVAASSKAGKPMLIVPFGGDQHFWGDRIHRMGLGPKPIPMKHLKAAKLAKKLTELYNNAAYSKNAKAVGEKLRNTSPTKDAADIIETEISNWTEGHQHESE